MWLWGIAPVGDSDSLTWDTDIDSFIENISSYNSMTYFHNLRFDGRFILDWLLNNGYKYWNGGRDKVQPKGTFSALISDMNKFYSITIRWRNGFGTELRDSAKKLPMTVSNIAKAFKMEQGKGEIDYHAERPVGYEPTSEEIDYLHRDVKIVAEALKETIAAGMAGLTIGGDSLKEYKRLLGEKYFRRIFPVLNDDMDMEIRRAYRGGFAYADPRYRSRMVGSGIVLDVNSLYPAVMYNALLPYGIPEYVEGRVEPTEDRPLTIFSITFTAKLKPNHIPCIQIKGSSIFGATEYLTEISEPTNLMVTNVDWKLYNDHYDIEVQEYCGGWAFQAQHDMFKKYIDKWSKVKAESVGGQREIAKLHLNSLYGKFASNPNVTGKIPVLENGVVRLVRGPDEKKAPVYTAVGVFVTSYARELTLRAAQANYDAFAYADTDSLHLIMPIDRLEGIQPKSITADDLGLDIDIDPVRMGAWKFEYAFTEAFYIRPKAYLEKKTDGAFHVAFAGLPEIASEKLTFDDLEDGKVIHGKLHPKAVPGGVVLEDVPYTLKL